MRLVEPWFMRLAKIPVSRPNEPDILPKRTKKVRLGRAVPSAGAEGAAAPARKTQFVSNITLITRKSTN